MQFPIHAVENIPSASDFNPGIDTTEETSKVNQNDIKNVQQQFINQLNGSSGLNDNSVLNRRFEVIPNPNEGKFKIIANRYSENEQIAVSIFDMKGQEIKQFTNLVNGTGVDVDLTLFSKGIYLVKFSSSTGTSETKRVNVQ